MINFWQIKLLINQPAIFQNWNHLPGEPVPLPQLAPHLLQRFKEDKKRDEHASLQNKNNH